MLLRKTPELTSADVTPKDVYFNRRNFLRGLGIAGAATLVGERFASLLSPAAASASTRLTTIKSEYTVPEKISSENDVTHYNNFYEFGSDKGDPAKNSQNFATTPWTVSVEGEVKTPRKFSLDEILKLAPLEERIYRHRCVERWSIVVPWIGYSLSTILKLVEPTAKARYVAFQSYYDPRQMPQARGTGLDYPYVEGLRLDEAMHPLTLLVCRHVRRNSSQSGRRPRAHGDPLEIRLQEHQVHSEYQTARLRTAHHLEPPGLQ